MSYILAIKRRLCTKWLPLLAPNNNCTGFFTVSQGALFGNDEEARSEHTFQKTKTKQKMQEKKCKLNRWKMLTIGFPSVGTFTFMADFGLHN